MLATSFLVLSCSDFLTRDPLGVMDENEFFTSPDAGLSAVVKCYKPMNDFYGFERPRMDIYNISTDDSEKGGSGAGDGVHVNELAGGYANPNNTDLINFWANLYKGIARCNIVLENVPVKELVDADGYQLDENTKNRYIGEATFLRAFYTFELCKVFGGVPIVNRTLTVDDSKSLVRATEAETARFILNDLAAVADNKDIPSAAVLPDNELGRVTKEAVWAMQARVYMYFAKDNEDYLDDGLNAAWKVIDSKIYSLEPNYQDLFLQNGYKSKEAIFTNIRGDVPSSYIYGSFLPVYSCPRSCGAYGFDQPTQNLVDEFEEGDPRLLYTIIQPGDVFPKGNDEEVLDFSTYPNTGYHNRKVFLIGDMRGAGWGDDEWSFHHIRYADVLLLYAEALVRTGGDLSTAADYINMVRQRANMSRSGDSQAISRVLQIPDVQLPDVTSTDDLFEAIKHERRVEFALEYQRFYDLKRWNIYVETMNAFSTLPESKGRGAMFKKGKSEVFPIPQPEIDRTGGSIIQNPGY